MGIHNVYFPKHTPKVLGNDIVGDFPGVVQLGQPGSKREIFQYEMGRIDKVPIAYGSYEDEDRIFYPAAKAGYLTEYVRVVTAREALVTGNHDNGGSGSMLPSGPGKKDALHLAGAGNNVEHGFLYSGKERLGIFKNPATLSQFGGGDKVHRLGNLKGLPYGPHTEADIP
jgi:hypothetical protein